MDVAIGILVVVVGILVSIGLHEIGHMVPAKKFGVRVSQYMIGFGPTLWSRKKGETEYGVKAFPLGGYVHLVGMYPAAPEGARKGKGFFSEVIAETRDASTEEIRPGEEKRAFYNLSTPKKLIVMFGGPFMNLLIAAVLFVVALSGIGVLTATTTVASVAPCVNSTSATADPAPCTSADQASPAKSAGLQEGDKIVSFDGTAVTSWDQLVDLINANAGQSVPMVVQRDGTDVTLSITPQKVQRQATDSGGAPKTTSSGDPVMTAGGYIGVGATSVREHLGIGESLSYGWDGLVATGKMVVTLPAKVYGVANSVITGAPRDPSSPMSVVGVGRISAEVAATDSPIVARVQTMLLLLASLNLGLFALNLIPLLPLDGGHLANALYEGAKRQLARVRRRVRPAPADLARMMPVGYVMFVALIAMGLLFIVADIVDPVTLT